MKITVITRIEIDLDQSLLEIYAQEFRERFDLPHNAPVNMINLLFQANLDGDIELPEIFELEGWEEDLTPQDIAELMDE